MLFLICFFNVLIHSKTPTKDVQESEKIRAGLSQARGPYYASSPFTRPRPRFVSNTNFVKAKTFIESKAGVTIQVSSQTALFTDYSKITRK